MLFNSSADVFGRGLQHGLVFSPGGGAQLSLKVFDVLLVLLAMQCYPLVPLLAGCVLVGEGLSRLAFSYVCVLCIGDVSFSGVTKDSLNLMLPAGCLTAVFLSRSSDITCAYYSGG